MRRIDYSFLKEKVSAQTLSLVSVISSNEGKEEIRKLQNPDLFDSLKYVATKESIRYSNEIEGIVVSDERFKRITNGEKPINHNEIEILGYKEAFEYINQHYDEIKINEDTIKSLHKTIMGNSRNSGEYKKGENNIVEFDDKGNRRVIFTPPNEKETPELMEQWVLAYNEAFNDSLISPLLLIPCAIVDFLSIHPFSDGNGRVSRLLTVLMLNKSGYDISRYISFETMIKEYLYGYYDALSKCNDGWKNNTNSYEPFIIYYLQILYMCYKKLDEMFITTSLKKVKKNERIENVLMNSIVPISKQDIMNYLPDVSQRSVEVTIQKLQKEDKINKIGTTRDARYIKK